MKKILLVLFLFVAKVYAAYDPVSVYLTWQRSPETTMTVHWITGIDRSADIVEYQRVGETQWKETKGSHVPMPEKCPYFIHTVELTGLLPNTDYWFRTGSDAARFKFRTMPTKSTIPIRFAVGGDIYHDSYELLTKMNRQVAQLNPMFILAGGDLAYYQPGRSKTMPRWLEWLIAWKNQLVTTDGRLIPIIPVIGNHDVKGGFDKTPADAQFFYSLFAMPGLQGYNVLDFGDYMSIVLLDSGHTHPIEGLQTMWLSKTLESRKSVPYKFAIYHVAAFPSVRHFNGKCKPEIRKYWSPLFEQYGVKTVFEHHDHAYKRTWPIKGGKIDPKGVLYLGDGGWAVEHIRKPKRSSKTWYLAKSAASRNAIMVTIHDNVCHFLAYDDNGKIIDEYACK